MAIQPIFSSYENFSVTKLIFFYQFFSQLQSVACSLRDQLVQMSRTHSSIDQYCITHKTISHQAAAAPGPEVRRECP